MLAFDEHFVPSKKTSNPAANEFFAFNDEMMTNDWTSWTAPKSTSHQGVASATVTEHCWVPRPSYANAEAAPVRGPPKTPPLVAVDDWPEEWDDVINQSNEPTSA